MLKRGYFVLLLAAFPLAQGFLKLPPIAYSDNCAAVLCPDTAEDPQCCNGVDYANSCIAQCSNGGSLDSCQSGACGGVQSKPGPIDCSVVRCSSEFTDPYCCNGKSVGNLCWAQCVEGITDVEQQCSPGYCPGDEPVACPFIHDPLCCNGQTFPNDCMARRELGDDVDSICTQGACEDQVACIAVYDPVCCYEKELFGNSCEAGRKYGDLPNFSEVCVPGEFSCVPPSPECDNPVFCFVDPCEFATCSFSGAVCVSNYCEDATYLGADVGGPCNPIWVDPQNFVVLTQQQCTAPPVFSGALGSGY